jgi:hypothetical protein
MKHDGSFGLTKLNQSKAEMQWSINDSFKLCDFMSDKNECIEELPCIDMRFSTDDIICPDILVVHDHAIQRT